MTTFLDLTEDVLYHIIRYFNRPHDIHALGQTCRYLRSLSQNFSVWWNVLRQLCRDHNAPLSSFNYQPPMSSKECENTVLRPLRFESVLPSPGQEPISARALSFCHPDFPEQPIVSFRTISGGRYALIDYENYVASLWDIGLPRTGEQRLILSIAEGCPLFDVDFVTKGDAPEGYFVVNSFAAFESIESPIVVQITVIEVNLETNAQKTIMRRYPLRHHTTSVSNTHIRGEFHQIWMCGTFVLIHRVTTGTWVALRPATVSPWKWSAIEYATEIDSRVALWCPTGTSSSETVCTVFDISQDYCSSPEEALNHSSPPIETTPLHSLFISSDTTTWPRRTADAYVSIPYSWSHSGWTRFLLRDASSTATPGLEPFCIEMYDSRHLASQEHLPSTNPAIYVPNLAASIPLAPTLHFESLQSKSLIIGRRLVIFELLSVPEPLVQASSMSLPLPLTGSDTNYSRKQESEVHVSDEANYDSDGTSSAPLAPKHHDDAYVRKWKLPEADAGVQTDTWWVDPWRATIYYRVERLEDGSSEALRSRAEMQMIELVQP